ncbi:hypothetical protein ACP4OV_025847 [Aristida adscensionis]
MLLFWWIVESCIFQGSSENIHLSGEFSMSVTPEEMLMAQIITGSNDPDAPRDESRSDYPHKVCLKHNSD